MPHPRPLLKPWPQSLSSEKWAWVLELEDPKIRHAWMVTVAEWEAVVVQSKEIVKKPLLFERTRPPRQKNKWRPMQGQAQPEKGHDDQEANNEKAQSQAMPEGQRPARRQRPRKKGRHRSEGQDTEATSCFTSASKTTKQVPAGPVLYQ